MRFLPNMHPYRGEYRYNLLTNPRCYDGVFSDLPSHFSYVCNIFFEGKDKVTVGDISCWCGAWVVSICTVWKARCIFELMKQRPASDYCLVHSFGLVSASCMFSVEHNHYTAVLLYPLFHIFIDFDRPWTQHLHAAPPYFKISCLEQHTKFSLYSCS